DQRLGPGIRWYAFRAPLEKQGALIRLNTDVVRIVRIGNHIDRVDLSSNGRPESIRGKHFISSMPITEFTKKLEPSEPAILRAAEKLRYRDFLTVCLIVRRAELFRDHWLYVLEPRVKADR